MKLLLRVWGYFRQDRPQVLGIFSLMVLSVAANLVKPWPLAVLIDSVLGVKTPPPFLPDFLTANRGNLLAGMIAATLIIWWVHAATAAFCQFRGIVIGLRGLARIRQAMFERLQRLSFRFHLGSQSGDLIQRASWDTYSFQTLFQQAFLVGLGSALALGLMIVIMWKLHVGLTLSALATIPLVLGAIRILGPRMRGRSLAAQKADSTVTSLIQQGIAGLPVTLVYGGEEKERGNFQQAVLTARAAKTRQHGAEVLYGFAMAVIFGLGVALVCWNGAHAVLSGTLTLGQLLVFFAYLTQFYEPLTQLTHAGSTTASALASAERIFEVLDTPEEVAEPAQPSSLPKVSNSEKGGREVRLEKVVFGYDPNQPVLKEIDLCLAAGEAVALVGPSGAGKTTLIQLFPRFYDPDRGGVLLDGLDLRELSLKELRGQMALVSQESLLLPGTIRENIAYGRPTATDSEIEAAAVAANLQHFISSLPEGYQTRVGEAAVRLSAGQKQRLNLARAFLRDAPIVLLDEPTSALDAENEASVVESLRRLFRGRTTLIAAHRFSTLHSVDRVIVLEEGRITQSGSPSELLRQEGYFSRLARAHRGEEAPH